MIPIARGNVVLLMSSVEVHTTKAFTSHHKIASAGEVRHSLSRTWQHHAITMLHLLHQAPQ